jgi:FG-GAP repeat
MPGSDFDGDGFDDLAVGVRGEDVDDLDDAGAVNVLFGSAAGLTAAGAQIWHQASPGVPGVAEPVDLFGNALA